MSIQVNALDDAEQMVDDSLKETTLKIKVSFSAYFKDVCKTLIFVLEYKPCFCAKSMKLFADLAQMLQTIVSVDLLFGGRASFSRNIKLNFSAETFHFISLLSSHPHNSSAFVN